MPANEANPIYPSERERRDLEALVRQQTCAQHVALRARIVLLASEGVGIQPSATRLGIARITVVRNWRRRWLASTGNRVAERLADATRSGTPATYSAEDACAIIEEDFAAHLAALVQQPRMHLAMDNLNIYYSESAVCLVAEHIGSEGDLGRKGRCGILRNAASRQAFLGDPEHPLGFHFTPKHASWLNQIEIWFSILVRRQLPIQERPGRQDGRFHQLLQRNHDQTIPLDISRYAPHHLTTSGITISA